jgi:hypothetical protein
MPPMNEMNVNHAAFSLPNDNLSVASAFVSISVNDIYIITPAEKPKEKARKEVWVLFAKKAITPPIAVARPAKSVSPKAIRILSLVTRRLI